MDVAKIVLSILIVLACAFLIGTILLQSSSRQGLSGAISGGAETFFGANKSTGMQKILQKLTGVVAALFVILTIVMNCIA